MLLTVFYEPTDMLIANKPFELEPKLYRQIKFMSPNIHELRKIAQTLKPTTSSSSKSSSSMPLLSKDDFENDLRVDNGKFLDEIAKLCDKLHDVIDNIIVTVGNQGIFIHNSREAESQFFTNDLRYIEGNGKSQLRHYPVTTIEEIPKSSTGAGDCFSSGFMTAMLNGKSEAICVSVGFEASLRALCSVDAIPKEFFTKNHACWMTPAKFNVIK